MKTADLKAFDPQKNEKIPEICMIWILDFWGNEEAVIKTPHVCADCA